MAELDAGRHYSKTEGQPQKTGVIFEVEDGQVVIYNGAGDKTWLVDTTAAPVAIPLPAASSDAALGVNFTVKRKTGGANALTIYSEGGNIDGTTTYSMATQFAAVRMVSDGTDYWTLPPVTDLSAYITSASVATALAPYVTSNSLSAALSTVASVPIGTILPYGGTAAPTGYELCFGQTFLRSDPIFAVIGTTYGVGDGSTTANYPDLRGRVVAGQDDMGGTSANRLTGVTGSVDGDTLGGTGGTETHTLVIAEMPAHTHTGPWAGPTATGSGTPESADTGRGSFASNSTGGGGAHNNVQPTIILNYIIKT